MMVGELAQSIDQCLLIMRLLDCWFIQRAQRARSQMCQQIIDDVQRWWANTFTCRNRDNFRQHHSQGRLCLRWWLHHLIQMLHQRFHHRIAILWLNTNHYDTERIYSKLIWHPQFVAVQMQQQRLQNRFDVSEWRTTNQFAQNRFG